MPEIIDLYNNARQIIKSIDKSEPIPDGLNKLCVHVWIVNSKGQFLLQQRVPTARRCPNMWGATGGGAQTKETSWQPCMRETLEELGLKLNMEKSVMIGSFKRLKDFVDVWLIYSDVDIHDLKLQPEDVQDVKWATIQQIEDMQQDGTFIPFVLPGFRMVCEYLDIVAKNKD